MEEELTLGIGAPPVANSDGTAADSKSKNKTENKAGSSSDTNYEDDLLKAFENEACTERDSVGASVLLKSARIALKAHVLPSIENEVHKALKEVADETAIKVFAENVKKLLLASPFGPRAVIGVDPGIRTGCKVAVVNDSGKFIADTVIHLQSEEEKKKAAVLLAEVIKTGDIRAIAVGNGTAGRETEHFIRASLKEQGLSIPVVMVNEAGASVYSASEVAREEFPDLDLTVRGAISIARRLQDPLAELVKVDPKSIGVGQYQHDVSPHSLKKSLELVVDTCVNSVGVNLNTASQYLLSRVSGIGPGLAKGIIKYRDEKGLFKSRESLLEVPRFSSKAYEQAAGFLRIPEAENPLDNTGVHPERYSVLQKVSEKLGHGIKELMGEGVKLIKSAKDLTKEIKDEVGEFTFDDILRELEKPGRDPREEFVPFQYRDDIFEVKDLKQEMICPGIVTNVTNFGAFVDIGVHQDGLVHLSQLADRFVKDPREVVSPGDRVTVKVIEVNMEKKQIALSMKGLAPKAARPQGDRRPRHADRQQGQNHQNRRPVEKPAMAAPSGPPPNVKPRSTPLPPGAKPAFGRSNQPSRPPKSTFQNNPFAGLASLKKELKRS